ncbi:alpha/beta-hydrolase [Backusella circina FSU 941]|nr:alpha/beta-hydrolase [Backusella circina FSU 941]
MKFISVFALFLVNAVLALPFKVYHFEPQNVKRVSNSAIIVFHEWWGVNDIIKGYAQKIADNTGIRTIIPDVFDGVVTTDPNEASQLFTNLDWNTTVSNLELLVKQLRKQKISRIGTFGLSVGGGLSLALATDATKNGKPLQATVTFYGIPSQDVFDTTIIRDTAIQGHFGGKDGVTGFSDPATVDQLESNLENAKYATIYRYPGQGHLFMDADSWSIEMRKELGFVDKDSDPLTEEKAVRDAAWGRTFSFFKTHLK